MRVRLVSEGSLDVGTYHQKFRQTEVQKGAVRILVQRALEQALGRDVDDWEIDSAVLPRAHDRSDAVSGYERKVCLAISGATADDCTSVAIVVDRDRTEGSERLKALRDGRTMAEKQGMPLAYRTALGVAIETVEAWLLADEKALNEAFALDPPVKGLPNPESLDGAPRTATHPKKVLQTILDRAERMLEAPYDEVALRVRLDVLEQRCKSGFAPFIAEVRTKCP